MNPNDFAVGLLAVATGLMCATNGLPDRGVSILTREKTSPPKRRCVNSSKLNLSQIKHSANLCPDTYLSHLVREYPKIIEDLVAKSGNPKTLHVDDIVAQSMNHTKTTENNTELYNYIHSKYADTFNRKPDCYGLDAGNQKIKDLTARQTIAAAQMSERNAPQTHHILKQFEAADSELFTKLYFKDMHALADRLDDPIAMQDYLDSALSKKLANLNARISSVKTKHGLNI
jgi:hypothetical protein